MGPRTGLRRARRRLRCARLGHMWVRVAAPGGSVDFCRRCRKQRPAAATHFSAPAA